MYVKLPATLAAILLAWSPVIAASPLDEVKDLVEDSAMVVSHWDMETFDPDVYLTAVAKLYGNPKSLKEPQQLIRESIATLRQSGVRSLVFAMSLRDLISTGPYVIALTDGKADASKISTTLEKIAAQLQMRGREPMTFKVVGDAVVYGNQAVVERVTGAREAKISAERMATFETAWKATGGAGWKIAFAPSVDTQTALRQMVPPFFGPFAKYNIQQVLDGAQWASLGIGTDGGPSVRVTVQSKDAESAAVMSDMVSVAADTIMQEMGGRPSMRGRLGEMVKLRSMLTPSVKKDQLVTHLSPDDIAQAQELLLKPMMESAKQQQKIISLKQIALAMLNFESVYGAYPPHASFDDQGKPMLSWRVYVLPFLEHNELYEQFRLDEPWDSKHNLQLVERMPDVFKNPNGNVEDGKTTYLVPNAEGTVFHGKNGTKLRHILDGTSKTLLCVDVAAEHAVTWTKPSDWEVDLKKPFDGMLGKRDAFTACRCDGSVQTFDKKELSGKQLKGMLTKAGAEIVP